MKVVKIEISGFTEHYFMPFAEASAVVEAELDGAEIGDSITLTVCEMTEEEYKALPEFMGW